MKIESSEEEAELLVQSIFKKKSDSSDNQMNIIFNKNKLRSLDITVMPVLSPEKFKSEPFIAPEENLPLPKDTVAFDMQIHSKTSCPSKINLLLTHFGQLEIRRNSSKKEEEIVIMQASKGPVNAWVVSGIFDSFKGSINLLN